VHGRNYLQGYAVTKASASFWKKKQKLLRGCRRLPRDSRQKFFGSFFKKELLPYRQG
jgi:hypothetical protein